MVIELSGVQFSVESYEWFQNQTSTQRKFDLKSQVWFQTIITSILKSLVIPSLQFDWLSAVRFIPKSHYFLL